MEKALKRDIQYVDHVQWVRMKMELVALPAYSVLSYTDQAVWVNIYMHKIVMVSIIL